MRMDKQRVRQGGPRQNGKQIKRFLSHNDVLLKRIHLKAYWIKNRLGKIIK